MNIKKQPDKPWGGRFKESTDQFAEQFTESVSYDQRLYHYDIMASIAHVNMLAKISVITAKECQQIISGLQAIETDIELGNFQWSIALEDVHMNIESALVSRIGEVGKKLHTARSRNDQVATDMRLYLRDEMDTIIQHTHQLIKVLAGLAEQHADVIMPGLTHMQIAQPVTYGHHLMAWAEMLLRDHERLNDCQKRLNVLPLGAAALAGTSFAIDREMVAKQLGFHSIAKNSLDAVSDRDFEIEFCAVASMIMMHLSRFSEEIIFWLTEANGFITLGDAWCTGSSIMPQKKNPDIPELIRGKTGRVYGDLICLLTIMKAQPLAYNRDNQEDKLALFDAVDTVKTSLLAYVKLLPTITINPERMYNMTIHSHATATDLADYLVRLGLAFRDAHEAVGKIVHYAIEQNKTLSELSIEELQKFSPLIQQNVYNCLLPDGSIKTRNHIGGTAPDRVRQAAKQLLEVLQ